MFFELLSMQTPLDGVACRPGTGELSTESATYCELRNSLILFSIASRSSWLLKMLPFIDCLIAIAPERALAGGLPRASALLALPCNSVLDLKVPARRILNRCRGLPVGADVDRCTRLHFSAKQAKPCICPCGVLFGGSSGKTIRVKPLVLVIRRIDNYQVGTSIREKGKRHQRILMDNPVANPIQGNWFVQRNQNSTERCPFLIRQCQRPVPRRALLSRAVPGSLLAHAGSHRIVHSVASQIEVVVFAPDTVHKRNH